MFFMGTIEKSYLSLLNQVKRDAKRLRKSTGIRLSEAQEQLSKLRGFQCFHELVTLAKKSAPSIGVVCFDIETFPISLDFKAAKSIKSRKKIVPKMRLACVYLENTDSYEFYSPSEAVDLIKLLNSADKVISFNGKKFDLLVLESYCQSKDEVCRIRHHVDLFEVFKEKSGFKVSVDKASQLNLGESKHTLGRDIHKCSIKEIKEACMSDVSQTYRLWKRYESNDLKFPSKTKWPFRSKEGDHDTVGQFLPPGQDSILDILLMAGIDDPFEVLTEGQFADAIAGFR